MHMENQIGIDIARGVCLHLSARGFATLTEFTPARGKRVDVIAIHPRGEIWVVECKSGRADFVSDHKWRGYVPWGDRFFWAVDTAFPQDILPDGSGLIIADSYDADVVRMAPLAPLASSRRKSLTQKIAHTAASRLRRFTEPVR